MKSAVTIVDDALEPAVFRRVQRAVTGLGERGLRGTYQRTFWFQKGAEPRSVVETAIVPLWKHAPARATGAEWWLSRMRTSNVQVDFHRDCDERLFRSGGPQRHPLRSSVLFLNCCRGGLLVVTAQEPNPDNPSFAPDDLSGDLVQPQPNRFVFFAGDLVHGVLDAHNQVPGRRLPREPQLRLAVVVNWWLQCPTDTPPFGDIRRSRPYARLALPPRREL